MLSLSLAASVYYSQAIVWAEMTTNVYAQGRVMWAGLVSCLFGIGITLGEIIGGGVAKICSHFSLFPIATTDIMHLASWILETPMHRRYYPRYALPRPYCAL